MTKILGWTMLMIGAAGSAMAGLTTPVPEIDSASGIAALALLSGGLLVLRARRRKS